MRSWTRDCVCRVHLNCRPGGANYLRTETRFRRDRPAQFAVSRPSRFHLRCPNVGSQCTRSHILSAAGGGRRACEGSVWCEGSSCAELPCSGSARLLTSGGNDGLRAGSILEMRKWAGPGCSRRGSSFALRLLRSGPAEACVSQPRAARREAGLNWRDLGRHYNERISEDFSLSV